MGIRVDIDSASDAEWDDLVRSSPYGHLLQTSGWAQLKSAFGWHAARVELRGNSGLVGGAQVLFRPLPFLSLVSPLTVAYIPKGPILDPRDETLFGQLLAGLDRLCHQHHALFLKIEPDVPQSPAVDQTFARWGFRKSAHHIQPLSTIIVRLDCRIEECLQRMSPKNRYNVRLSERKGIVVQVGDETDIPRFYALSLVTSGREQFKIHNLEYYRRVYQAFRPAGHVRLFLARYGDKLLAGLMAFAFGTKAWYLYGASSNEERHRMPNYALQWAAIQWAQSMGCKTYDLWGIPDEAPTLEEGPADILKSYLDNPPPGTLWGVYRFKRGFGGAIVRYAGAFDRVYHPTLYAIYQRLMARRGAVGP